jgi:hypothetical protein
MEARCLRGGEDITRPEDIVVLDYHALGKRPFCWMSGHHRLQEHEAEGDQNYS